MKQNKVKQFCKRGFSIGLSLALATTMLPPASVKAADEIMPLEATTLTAGSVLATETTLTKNQPFTSRTGSRNFSTPAFTIRQVVEGEKIVNGESVAVRPGDENAGVAGAQKSDLLIASAEAKYDSLGDGGGQDLIVSVSSDQGKNWKYSYPFYFPDSVGSGVEGATTVSNPVIVDKEILNSNAKEPGFVMGGTIYVFANVYPGGVAVTSDDRFEAPKAGSGYVTVNDQKRLALTTKDSGKDASNPSTAEEGSKYEYYVGDFQEGRASVMSMTDNSATDYQVDQWYNLYKKNSSNGYDALLQDQLGTADGETAKKVQQNVFYADSDLHVYKTGYVMCVTSEDNGLTWSVPEILNPSLYETEDTVITLSAGKGLKTSADRIVIPATIEKADADASASMLWKCTTDETHGWHHADVPAIAAEENNTEPTWTKGGEIVELSRGQLRMFIRTGRGLIYYADAGRGLDSGETEPASDVENVGAGSDMFTFKTPVATGTSVTPDAKVAAIEYTKPVDAKERIIMTAQPTGSGHTNGRLTVFGKDNAADLANPTITRLFDTSLYNGNFAAASMDEMYYGSNIALLWENGRGDVQFESYNTLDIMGTDHYVAGLEVDVTLNPNGAAYTRSGYRVAGVDNLEPADRVIEPQDAELYSVTFDRGIESEVTVKIPSLYSIKKTGATNGTLGGVYQADSDAGVSIENAEFTFRRPSNAENQDQFYQIYSEGMQRYLTNVDNVNVLFTTTPRNSIYVAYSEDHKGFVVDNRSRLNGEQDHRYLLFDLQGYTFNTSSTISASDARYKAGMQVLKKVTKAEADEAQAAGKTVYDLTEGAEDDYKYVALGADDTIDVSRKYLIAYKVAENSDDSTFGNGGLVILYPHNTTANHAKLVYGTKDAVLEARKTLTITPKAKKGTEDLKVNNITYHITVENPTISVPKNGSAFIDGVTADQVVLGEAGEALVTVKNATETRKALFDCVSENPTPMTLDGYATTPNWDANVKNAEFVITEAGTDGGDKIYTIFSELEGNYLENQIDANQIFTKTRATHKITPVGEGDEISFEIMRAGNTGSNPKNGRYLYFYYKRMGFDAVSQKDGTDSWSGKPFSDPAAGDFGYELLEKRTDNLESDDDPIPGYKRATEIVSKRSYLITEYFTDPQSKEEVILVMYPRSGIKNQSKMYANTEVSGVEISAKADIDAEATADITINGTVHTIVIDTECDHDCTWMEIVKEATCTEAGIRGQQVCSVCREEMTPGTVVEALGHDFDDPDCKVEADPDHMPSYEGTGTDGQKIITCIRCDVTKTETYPALDYAKDVLAKNAADAEAEIDETLYTEGSYAIFNTALTAAKAPAQDADLAAIVTLMNNLQSAKDGLVTKALQAKRDALKEAIQSAIADAADETYTESTRTALAEAVADYKDLTEEQLISAIEEMEEDQLTTLTNTLNDIERVTVADEKREIAKQELETLVNSADIKTLIDGKNADKKYTAETWAAFEKAYKDALDEMATADEARLKELKSALSTAKANLKTVTGGDPGTPGTEVKDGQSFTIASGTYQVVSAKDKTVIITKGKDAKTVKVGPTVVINKETYKVVGIGKKAFSGLKSARKVVINANVETIGDQAFEKSKKIKNITLGKDVKKIGKKAFANCSKLNKVIIKGKALKNKGIGKQAFSKTAKKATVKWPKGLKSKDKNKLKKAIKKAGLKVK